MSLIDSNNNLKLLIETIVTESMNVSKLKSYLADYVKNTNRDGLENNISKIVDIRNNPKYKNLLYVGDHQYAYRLIDFTSVKDLSKILGNNIVQAETEEYKSINKGILMPPKNEIISSWTVNPRSLIYSGFMSVIGTNKNLVILRAKIKNNIFFGNPDKMAGTIKAGDGYSLEREILGVGPIKYDKAFVGFKKPEQSLEGLAMDLINKLSKLNDIDFNNDYYFPSIK